jgi:hypothetical protein
MKMNSKKTKASGFLVQDMDKTPPKKTSIRKNP